MRILLGFGISLSVLLQVVAGEPTASAVQKGTEPRGQVFLTGNLRIDLFSQDHLSKGISIPQVGGPPQYASGSSIAGKKSPWLAAGMSAGIPGLGEFYSESYLKSVIFLGAEVASWIIYGVYTNKGNDHTDEYEGFANVHWSVVDYALWLNQYKNCSIVVDPNTNLAPFQRVDWGQLNSCERTVEGFSHTLPPYGTQQYFELIGKYAQYTTGWDDADPSIDYARPENLDRVSPRFRFYRDMRGEANDFFNIASTAVGVVVANHILSALDAAWSASRYNRNLQTSAQLRLQRTGEMWELVPRFDVKVVF